MSINLNGGYSCKLVSQPKELQTECSICLQLLRAPEMVSCCGNKFCQSCIGHILNKNNRCPLCGQTNVTTMPDRQLERTLNSLELYCVHVDEGCKWTGELRALERHLNQGHSKTDWLKGCEYASVKCKHCHRKYPRREVMHHMTQECSEARIPCEFKEYGCGAMVLRKNMDKHISDNTKQHIDLFECFLKRLELNINFKHALSQFSKEIRGQGEAYVSRKSFDDEMTELRLYTSQVKDALQPAKSVLWIMVGAFLIAVLVTLLAFCFTTYFIRDLQQENRNLKGQLATISTNLKFSDEKFRVHEKELREKLEATILENKAEKMKLQETIDGCKECSSHSETMFSGHAQV